MWGQAMPACPLTDFMRSRTALGEMALAPVHRRNSKEKIGTDDQE